MPAPTDDVLSEFLIQGRLVEMRQLTGGNINESWMTAWRDGSAIRRYVHQRINTTVFQAPELLIRNHLRIWEAACKSPIQPPLAIPKLVALKAGGYLLITASGAWRTTEFIERSTAIQKCENPAQALQAAQAFAGFQLILNTIPTSEIQSAIPHFQNVPRRLDALAAAVEANHAGRLNECRQETTLLLAQRQLAGTFDQAVTQRTVPERVVHADLKINNVLFDLETGHSIAVIDLDACMPGTVLYDFGDFVRSAGVPCEEDETDSAKIRLDLDLFTALAEGYIGRLKAALTAGECALFHLAPQVLALSLASRFLTDHLNGDIYFRTKFPGHNLVRARTQIQILASLRKVEREMLQIVGKISGLAV
ncbi:MAG: aminoglycoside phosphotransferase family protein [Oligoflexia bacterium]|nr:aminoglycoside phosphotransferase family protein [Oligoflexia bacterium]